VADRATRPFGREPLALAVQARLRVFHVHPTEDAQHAPGRSVDRAERRMESLDADLAHVEPQAVSFALAALKSSTVCRSSELHVSTARRATTPHPRPTIGVDNP